MENGQHEEQHPELAEHKRQLDRIAASIEAMEARGRPKLVRSAMSLQERVAYVREFGETAYLALPWGEVGPRR